MDNAVLNSEFITTKAGNITVYNYDGETREYISHQLNILQWVNQYSSIFLFRRSWYI
ncbi:hypothetical protein [Escherichia coli]|uniref:hypothetical protein n=1 Tax=Escherichia coli TaxID=562 RepID=UPI003F53F209